jgi:hypothetical protein
MVVGGCGWLRGSELSYACYEYYCGCDSLLSRSHLTNALARTILARQAKPMANNGTCRDKLLVWGVFLGFSFYLINRTKYKDIS